MVRLYKQTKPSAAACLSQVGLITWWLPSPPTLNNASFRRSPFAVTVHDSANGAPPKKLPGLKNVKETSSCVVLAIVTRSLQDCDEVCEDELLYVLRKLLDRGRTTTLPPPHRCTGYGWKASWLNFDDVPEDDLGSFDGHKQTMTVTLASMSIDSKGCIATSIAPQLSHINMGPTTAISTVDLNLNTHQVPPMDNSTAVRRNPSRASTKNSKNAQSLSSIHEEE
ncbi:hypothetical protein BU15DRAFT_67513 [Melanogaster broomeanus]|nr:hypothetical protein BU15DRAFT_67513 [Melanogaster broomeanus]